MVFTFMSARMFVRLQVKAKTSQSISFSHGEKTEKQRNNYQGKHRKNVHVVYDGSIRVSRILIR